MKSGPLRRGRRWWACWRSADSGEEGEEGSPRFAVRGGWSDAEEKVNGEREKRVVLVVNIQSFHAFVAACSLDK